MKDEKTALRAGEVLWANMKPEGSVGSSVFEEHKETCVARV